MTTFTFILLFTVIICLTLTMHYVDAKYSLRLVDWINGRCKSPFAEAQVKAETNAKDKQIAELKERIQVLEKIVSEPAYELNRKINNL